jgi:large subunit ribosomal protein L15
MSEFILKAPKGASKNRKRLGRGIGTGQGKTAGKGHKGQNSRSGGGVRLGFEGGQTPLYRRLPKVGFKNSMFKVNYNIINLDLLEKFDNGTILKYEDLLKNDLIYNERLPVKILGNGKFTKKIEVHADKFSKSALEKIEKAGGKAVTK